MPPLLMLAGTTGHAEAVQVQYDPAVTSYEELLEVFWGRHDPTQLNAQVLQACSKALHAFTICTSDGKKLCVFIVVTLRSASRP